MGILSRNVPTTALAALMAFASPTLFRDAAFAAPKNSDKSAAKSAAAKSAYEGGVKAFQSGRYQNCVDQLSGALRGGGLSSTEMARGLYYRGLAYKRLEKPGLAISDLTSALWLKNGLSDEERKAATAERAEAYKVAGLGDGNSGADRVAASDPKSETSAPAASAASATAAASDAGTSGMSAAAAPSTFATTRPADTGGVPQPLSLGAETSVPPPPPSAMRQAVGVADQVNNSGQAVAAAPTATESGSGGLGGIFSNISNLFSGGSGSSGEVAPSTSVTTASTSEATPQTSSWNDSTTLTQGAAGAAKTSKATKTAAVPPVPAPASKPASTKSAQKSKGGKYKLHIAALRSRAAADALAQKLMQEHSGDFHDRQPAVDEAVIGSMGTFYRVRIGSYKTADETRGLCNTLRNSGYDCLVVSN